MASAVDLGDTLTEYNRSLTPDRADALALFLDWLAVGMDLSDAMDGYAE